MVIKLHLHEHVFTSSRAGQVTLLSLQSDTVLRLRGPIVGVWTELLATGDLSAAAAQLGLSEQQLFPLLSALVHYGFALAEARVPTQQHVADESIEWPGVGVMEVEVVTDKYGEAFAFGHLLNAAEKN